MRTRKQAHGKAAASLESETLRYLFADTDISIPTSRPPGRKIEGELTQWPAYSKVTTALAKSRARA
jgi:hypothetical protein